MPLVINGFLDAKLRCAQFRNNRTATPIRDASPFITPSSMGPMKTTRHTPVILLALTAVASISSTGLAQHGTIDCRPGGHPESCNIPIQPGQTSVTLRFRSSPEILSTRPILYYLRALPSGAIDSVLTGSDQIARIEWPVPQAGTDTSRILVQTSGAGVLQTDTIRILPLRRPADRVEIPGYAPFVWLRETWIPSTIRPEIVGVQGDMDEERCRSIRFAFQPRGGGSVQPDTGIATWVKDPGDVRGRCFAETRWKLGEATGGQQLRVVVGDGQRVAHSERLLHANVREAPRIVAGVAAFTRFIGTTERYCPDRTSPRDGCRDVPTEADSVKREFEVERKNATEPFFGVESPLFLSDQPGNSVTRFMYKRVRFVVGSTFERPMDNLFVGVTVIPLFAPSYERIPLQIQTGWRPREGGYFLGGSLDGSALVQSALKALGATL